MLLSYKGACDMLLALQYNCRTQARVALGETAKHAKRFLSLGQSDHYLDFKHTLKTSQLRCMFPKQCYSSAGFQA